MILASFFCTRTLFLMVVNLEFMHLVPEEASLGMGLIACKFRVLFTKFPFSCRDCITVFGFERSSVATHDSYTWAK